MPECIAKSERAAEAAGPAMRPTAGLAVAASARLLSVACAAILIGLGYGPITPASSHILARTTPVEKFGLIFSLKQTGVPIGGALAGAIVLAELARRAPKGAAGAVTGVALFLTYFGGVIGPTTFALIVGPEHQFSRGFWLSGAIVFLVGVISSHSPIVRRRNLAQMEGLRCFIPMSDCW